MKSCLKKKREKFNWCSQFHMMNIKLGFPATGAIIAYTICIVFVRAPRTYPLSSIEYCVVGFSLKISQLFPSYPTHAVARDHHELINRV